MNKSQRACASRMTCLFVVRIIVYGKCPTAMHTWLHRSLHLHQFEQDVPETDGQIWRIQSVHFENEERIIMRYYKKLQKLINLQTHNFAIFFVVQILNFWMSFCFLSSFLKSRRRRVYLSCYMLRYISRGLIETCCIDYPYWIHKVQFAKTNSNRSRDRSLNVEFSLREKSTTNSPICRW